MPRPGVTVTLRDTPAVSTIPNDTGTAFMAGLSDRGPATFPVLIHSLAEFVTVFGDRVTYSSLYDAVEVFFREGGGTTWISRVVGPGATKGLLNLNDNAATISLVATAIGPGAWSNTIKVQVLAGVGAGTFVIRVLDANNVILEDSGDLLTQDAAITWALKSNYIRFTLGASALNPQVAAATALSAGNDDRNNIVDAQWLTALNLFTPDLGPGQVLAPGRTTTAGQNQLIAHAEANGRVALIDLTNSGVAATLQSAAAAIKSRFAAAYAPWPVISGVTTGTTRTVPLSAFVAGLISRNDRNLGPNRAAAGNAGVFRSVVDLSQVGFDDATRAALNTSGVNLIRAMFGTFRVYGWRSLAGSADSAWVGFNNARLYMALAGELDLDGENFAFSEIDGVTGDTVVGYHGALYGTMMQHYDKGELYGNTPEEAFSVNTGPDVNTTARIQNNELHAIVTYKNSPFAEWVQIELVKRLITQSL